MSDSERTVPGHTIPELFSKAVKKYGDRVALRQKIYGVWEEISWRQYYAQARNVGAALAAMGLKKGESVSIIGDNCREWVFIDLGVQCIGGVAVGVYTTSAAEQVQYVVEHSDSKFLFVENEEQLDKWIEVKKRLPKLEKVIVWDATGLRDFDDPMLMTFADFVAFGAQEDAKTPELFEERMAAVTPDDLAVLIYTSGTTGPPKGAMLSHGNVTWSIKNVDKVNPIYESDEVLSFLPLCHVFERLFTVFGHLAIGYTVNFVENLDTVAQNIREASPTVGYAVPRIWEKYHSTIMIRMADATWLKRRLFHAALKAGRDYAEVKLSKGKQPSQWQKFANFIAWFAILRKLKERLGFERMRLAFSGAAPISPEVLLFFHSIGLNLFEGYGQTEGSAVASANRADKIKLGTVGVPLPDCEIKIADDGEILVKNPGVFKGYFKDKKTTAKTLKNGWLHTGDVGIIDGEGFLKIVDRKKDIIITAGGKNIAPQHLENQLKFSSYINDAVVIGDRRKFLTALIVLDEQNIEKYAQDEKIQFSTYTDLAENEAINKLIEQEVEKVNKKNARVEHIRKFSILPKKLYEEDGDVTPTMKVKRKSIQETYRDLIEEMYGGAH